MSVPVVAFQRGYLDQSPSRFHFEGDGVGGSGEVTDDGPDVTEGVL
jgi:hypothetical protein